jgi:hypothetical protein
MNQCEQCAPSQQYVDGSCIPTDLLSKMIHAYNTYAIEHKLKKIQLDRQIELMHPNKYRQYMLHKMNKRLKNTCDNQMCWTKQEFIKYIDNEARKELSSNIFRPVGPQGSHKWLNTINIEKVIEQYEHIYQDFKFMGALPMDFDDLPYLHIHDLNYANLQTRNINRIGFVFNTDEHYKSGTHWVSMFVDLNKFHIYYFDSYGIKPEKRVRLLMRRIYEYCKAKCNCTPDIDYNYIKHQRGGSECGMYSIFFIIKMLEDDDYYKFIENVKSDDYIWSFRQVYFNA